jgi:hypothetical protein
LDLSLLFEKRKKRQSGTQITSHTDCHVIGAIPLVEVVLDIGD